MLSLETILNYFNALTSPAHAEFTLSKSPIWEDMVS